MEKALDEAITQIHNLSGTDDGLEKLNTKLSEMEDILRSLSTVDGEGTELPILLRLLREGTCQLPTHTLGIIHLLLAQSNTVEGLAKQPFLEATEFLFDTFDPQQAAKACKRFTQLVHKYTTILTTAQFAVRGILPLRKAALQFAPRPNCLTPIHADFLQLALLCKLYKEAAAFIDLQPIYEVDPKATGLTSVDLLRYFYYGGMVFVGLKRFGDALDFLKTAITTPAQSLSAVAVESYKKFLLVSVLVPDGKALGGGGGMGGGGGDSAGGGGGGSNTAKFLPKYTATVVARHIRHTGLPYHDILSAAQAEKAEDVDRLLKKHAEVLNNDNNMGLAKQVLNHVMVKKIKKLTKTFVTLSLEDIAKRTGLANAAVAEKLIVDQVERGLVVAQVDEVTGMVHFSEDKPEDYSSTQTIARLDKELWVVMELAQKVKALDVRISTTPQYVAKVVGARGGGSAQGGGGGGGGGGTESSTPDVYDGGMGDDDFGSTAF